MFDWLIALCVVQERVAQLESAMHARHSSLLDVRETAVLASVQLGLFLYYSSSSISQNGEVTTSTTVNPPEPPVTSGFSSNLVVCIPYLNRFASCFTQSNQFLQVFPLLDFKPELLFCIGSPVALFLALGYGFHSKSPWTHI